MAILKRLNAPRFWRIPRATKKFVLAVRPGSHPADKSYPLGVVIRDILKLARNMREVRTILNSRLVELNGRVMTDRKFPVGIFDVIHIKKEEKYYLVLPKKGGFEFKEVEAPSLKLEKVKRKTMTKGGRIQLTFHDGENKLVDDNSIKTNDTVVMDIKTKEIKKVLKYESGATVMIISGERAGSVGKIKKIEVVRSSMPNRVIIDVNGEEIESIPENIFVIDESILKVKSND